ncbi:hypothetical protein GCM10009526_09640 [Glutamicibacter creatinolyticus]
MASWGVTSGLALNPTAVAAYATIRPNTGLRPAARKAKAPSGIMTRYAESLMMWAIIELKAMENVNIDAGNRPMVMRNIAVRRPLRSATLTPIRTTTIVAKGGKVA